LPISGNHLVIGEVQLLANIANKLAVVVANKPAH